MTTRTPHMTLLEAAGELARTVADEAMRWYRSNLVIETKADGSPVTVADRSAEHAARAWLREHFPHDGIQGEEFGDENPDAARRWIVDPIDGTNAFVRGVPLWATLVACCEGETVLAGAASFPVVSEHIMAAPGEGCWWNGSRAQVSNVSSLRDATGLTSDERFPGRPLRAARWRALAAETGLVRTWGDCYGYLLVATGRAEFMVDDIVNPWDVAALQPVIEEAGGVFTAWDGQRTAFGGSAIATNAALAERVRRTLQEGA